MTTARGQAPSAMHAWLLAIRPQTLVVGATPVIVGTAVAFARDRGALHVGAAIAALVGALLIQIGTNLANDVFDFENGADTAARRGPLRVTQAGLVAPHRVRAAMVACFAAATIVGAYLASIGGWPIVAIGIASIAAGVAYTGGPYPLGYHGFGDVLVFAFFGPVAVCGTAYVETGRVGALAAVVSLASSALATAVLVVNNVRDVATDRVAGKRTLVVKFGRRFGVIEYGALVALAHVAIVAAVAAALAPPAALIALATIPWSARLAGALARDLDPNRCLVATARMLCVHGLAVAAAIALGGS
jgi:1,4-dihydroxy-2-naphthoate octaprenyltransferase